MTMILSPKRTQRRRWLAAISVAAIAVICAPLVVHGPTCILWNASASVPIGLYIVRPNAPLHVGNLAVSSLPTNVQNLADERRYLPSDVLLIKPVAAVSGSEICRHGTEISIDGVRAGDAQPVDRRHRPMPDWQGCRVIASTEIFLMNPAVTDSFDGRYFGPIKLDLVKGRAFPVLTFSQHPRT